MVFIVWFPHATYLPALFPVPGLNCGLSVPPIPLMLVAGEPVSSGLPLTFIIAQAALADVLQLLDTDNCTL